MTGFVLDMFSKPEPEPEPKLPPNKPTGNTESFKLLGTLFEEFTVYVNRN